MTEPGFFAWNLVVRFLGCWKVFQVSWKIDAWNFSDFCLKVQQQQVLTAERWPIDPKWGFSSFYGKLTLRSFLVSCITYSSIKTSLTYMTFLRKILIWGFWTKNSPKWIQNESLTKKCCMKHIWYFNWSDSIVKALNQLEWIVWGKILFWSFLTKRGPNWTQNEVFKYYEKSIHGTFLIFLYDV